MSGKLAYRAALCYNLNRNIVVSEGAWNTAQTLIHLVRRCIVDTIPHSPPADKPHYVYELAYPESMGGRVFYVGKGTKDRIDYHEWQARNGIRSHKCNIIRKIQANGEQVIKRKLAYFQTHEEAFWYEIALIFFMDGLVNLTDGGEGTPGRIVSEETRRRQSESLKASSSLYEAHRRNSAARKGSTISEEQRRKQSEAMKGRTLSEEHRRKVGEASKRNWQSEEYRTKVQASHKRYKPTEEHRRKVSEAEKASPHVKAHLQALHESHKGRPLSEEHRRKLEGRVISEETRRKMSESAKRRIQQREQNGRFKSG